ncbi:unnamed protein product [Rotaria socialis]|uniref:Uncharacterized protein n=1 Tax=Rotaria socialis TaxID=392032 RepID=A0A820WBH0_9BILA|nr:unnamed protein product [Rotaria socialis]
MNHQTIDFIPLCQSIHLGKQWLTSMGYAAHLFNINIQYSMNLPRHALQASEIDRVTQARSNQYQPGAPYKTTAQEILPDREILIATLSTGRVAFGDGINYTDKERIM